MEIKKETWLIGEKERSEYLTACENAATVEEAFNNFKRDPAYTTILEHDGYNFMGIRYYDFISKNYPHLLLELEAYSVNDKFGNADTYDYYGLKISPSTLRYVKTLGDIEKAFGSLDHFSIAEIGCGYGGQCLIINTRFNIRKYTMFDLAEPCHLINKYLTVNSVEKFEFGDLEVPKGNDLVISNYAWSECDTEIQDEYIEKVIKHASHGYLTINAFTGLGNRKNAELISILKTFHPTLTAERDPLSSHETFIVIW